MYKNSLENATKLILGEKYGLIITSRIILSFILNGPGRAIQEEDKSKRVIATR